MLDQYGGPVDKKEEKNPARREAEMRAMVSQIQNLRARFDDGRLLVHMDKSAILELFENKLKKSLARQEAGMTAAFEVDLTTEEGKDHEGELVLPNRSVFVKFVPEGRSVAEFAVTYLQRARDANPSEYWLLTPSEQEVDFQFDPIFTENKITRGRLRTYPLAGLLGELVGKDYEVLAAYEDRGFRFVISPRQPVPAEGSNQ